MKSRPNHWWIIFNYIFNRKAHEEAQRKMGEFRCLTENELSSLVIGVAIDVHSQLGPGLLENVYKQVLHFKLLKEGIFAEMEKPMPIQIDGFALDLGYKIDILVEQKLVIELKSVKEITDIHIAQTLNYLKLGDFKLGLILNFNVTQMKSGIKRVIRSGGPRQF